MRIDYKIYLLAWCLCWLQPLNQEAKPVANSVMLGGCFEIILADQPTANLPISEAIQPPRHYVVIGAFRELRNANKLIRRVASVGFEPKYFLNKKRGLYYVYIVIYDDIVSAYRVSRRLRDVNFIKDAWVFSAGTDEPLSERLIASVEANGRELLSDVAATEQPKKTANPVKSPPRKTSGNAKELTPPVKNSGTSPVASAEKPKEETKSTTFMPTPSKAINQLAQADKGDVIIFENLLFHKNSSVLRKISRDEMQRLNDVLNTRANLRIKIHGHTNGDFKGEVYLLDENDDRFFKLSGKNKVVKGDDKLLSTERAKVIKRYLGAQGISEDRIETQGWGDRRMLYPKGHLKAPLNRRVEIEVIEN